MNKKDKERLKQVAIGFGTAVVAVGIGVYKLTRKNKDNLENENMTVEQSYEFDEEIDNTDIEEVIFKEENLEYVILDDEFNNPIVDVDLHTEEEYEEYMRDRYGENADDMMEKIESISSYAQIYMESGYEHGCNYHDEPYYTQSKDDGLGSEIAYDLNTDEYVGGDPFDVVENHEENGFPEHHWE